MKSIVPALFVLDDHLLDLNGIELVDRLQKIDAIEQVPILLLSTNLPKQEVARRHIASMEKPFEVDDLMQAVATVLSDEGVSRTLPSSRS
ncbi:MAG TPA: hypothetical protein VFV38_51460 [Ktedonobacteraceae bacterium]|nr:hypothetical protein [Ktedonobacteraceae bacterium]